MQCIQLDFFQSYEESEIECLKKQINEISLSTNKVRKSLFAKNAELNKKVMDLESRFYILEKNICRPSIEYNFSL